MAGTAELPEGKKLTLCVEASFFVGIALASIPHRGLCHKNHNDILKKMRYRGKIWEEK